MQQQSILLCMGTRPEIIKMAPVYFALKKTDLNPVILHTSQHDELASPFYQFFGITPDYELSLEKKHTSIGQLLATIIARLDSVLQTFHPCAMLVHGDTSSALAGALTAYSHKIPIGHIEAGLRSHNAYAPFPEEKNRELIARLAYWNFVPTHQADINLQAEGIPKSRRYQVGNTIVDAINWGMTQLQNDHSRLINKTRHPLKWITEMPKQSRLLLVTAHRRESWYGGIANIAQGIRDIVESHSETRVLWLVHPNPLIKNAIQQVMSDIDEDAASRICLAESLNYPELLWVLQRAWLILTDSGGLQEEAIAINKPVLVLRNNTERPEVIDSGGGVLIGTDADAIKDWVNKLLTDNTTYHSMQTASNPFGNGQAGKYIADILQQEILHPDPSLNQTNTVNHHD